ncbi:MAG: tRNA 2-selenouridine(34) synthase MnmH [Phenylobacterium sp.]|nr:tRNA 2-selenouridine(34) synthase MnmH [Phenylobacterium sp.]THD58660.1 MAG: tRNA 2-selenouridine(34) synthase MnmH [Phenylobacterium sp.]
MSGIEILETADLKSLAVFDAVIDVRSPGEFAEDHAPGAVNLPVLTDAERAEVGTIYVQESRFRARRIGAAYIARNVARHLETALADRQGSFRPLVYCWRGGQRSNAMATILSQVGWRTGLLAGGYKTWRRHVTARLYDGALPLRLVLIDGGTGTGKTEVLVRLAERGVQVVDLEGLAAHRGSLFGALAGQPQPPQKLFESRLLAILDGLDPARPVVVEAESSKIGERMTPPALWQAMTRAGRFELTASPQARARYLARTYSDISRDRPALDEALRRLPTPPGRKRLEAWGQLADAGAFEALALALMELHYDPAYRRSSRGETRASLGVIDLGEIAPADLDRAADMIAARLADA